MRKCKNKKYIIRLATDERKYLQEIVSKGKASAYKIKHANILLKSDADGPAWTDEKIADAFSAHRCTVEGIRTRFVTEGFEAVIERKKRLTPPRERILDGEKEARLIALGCTEPPKGRSRWTLQLLADKMIELNIVESISGKTVGRGLKKTSLNRI